MLATPSQTPEVYSYHLNWRKLGHVFAPSGAYWWARRYASFPNVELLEDGRIRVYFTSLDDRQYGRGGYVDLNDLGELLAVGADPILDSGGPGDFDESGANPFCVIRLDGRRFMYYQGWQRLCDAPYAIFTGLAVAQPGEDKFKRISQVPLLDRCAGEAHIRGAPFVLVEGDRLRMWYVSSTEWRKIKGKYFYSISVRHATSLDGILWMPQPCHGLEPVPGQEYAIGKPTVLKDGNIYRMWYSVRSFERPYAIGYAESSDGQIWERKDALAGIQRSEDGWDSDMICYPYVVRIGNRVVMFYNGNGHGQTGFGWAVLE